MSNEKAPKKTLKVVAPEAVDPEEETVEQPEALPTYASPDGELHSPITGKWNKDTRRQQRAAARSAHTKKAGK
jgi:hypothetical protein